MRVLQLIPSVNPTSGGPIEGVLRQYAVIRDQGVHEWDIASLDGPNMPWVAKCPAPVFALGSDKRFAFRHWRYVPWLRYGYAPAFIPWLRANMQRYDAIVVNGLWHYLDFACARVLPEAAVPYTVYPHGMLDPWFRRSNPLRHYAKQLSWWTSEGVLLKHARAVLFTTDDERDLANNAFRPFCVAPRVVGYGTAAPPPAAVEQIEAFRRTVPQLGARRFLLFLSRIHPKKGCDMLIKAFAEVARSEPDLDVVMAGPDQIGWVAELRALAERHGIAERIHWPGMLSGDAKWGAYRNAEAFILPSHQENFGIVVAEALAVGTPTLISRRVNLWTDLEECRAGLTFEDTVAGTARAIKTFLEMSVEKRVDMTRNGVRIFAEKYDVAVVTDRLMDTLRDVARESKKAESA